MASQEPHSVSHSGCWYRSSLTAMLLRLVLCHTHRQSLPVRTNFALSGSLSLSQWQSLVPRWRPRPGPRRGCPASNLQRAARRLLLRDYQAGGPAALPAARPSALCTAPPSRSAVSARRVPQCREASSGGLGCAAATGTVTGRPLSRNLNWEPPRVDPTAGCRRGSGRAPLAEAPPVTWLRAGSPAPTRPRG